ncbi:MAG: trimeric intracellular cation channel family protein, partial [Janthinobacterium lividum]
ILAGEVPTVLRADLYAVAALAAGSIVSLGDVFDMPPFYPMLLGSAACVFLRMMAIYCGWHVPAARSRANGSP